MGLRSLEDGYVPPILDVSKLDRKLLVSNAESLAGVRALVDREGDLRRASRPARSSTSRAGSPRSSTRASSSASSPTAAGSTSPPTSGTRPTRARRWSTATGGSGPAAVRRALEEHAAAEAPNEACGLLALRDGVAERYVPCVNRLASPYRFELQAPDPALVIDLEDDGLELAVFHSHPTELGRAVADRPRQHRPLGGPPVPDPVAADRRARRRGGSSGSGRAAPPSIDRLLGDLEAAACMLSCGSQ